MKKYIYILLFLGGFLLGILMKCCPEKPSNIEVIIPEEKGEFAINPKEKEIEYRDSIVYKDKIITIENPINKELYNNFAKAKDSLEQLKLYLDAITVRSYEDTVEDGNLIFNYKAKTTGTLDEFKFNYTIKERQIEAPSKKHIPRLYYGGEVVTDWKDATSIKGGLIFIPTDRRLYSLGYDTRGNWYLGAYFSF